MTYRQTLVTIPVVAGGGELPNNNDSPLVPYDRYSDIIWRDVWTSNDFHEGPVLTEVSRGRELHSASWLSSIAVQFSAIYAKPPNQTP